MKRILLVVLMIVIGIMSACSNSEENMIFEKELTNTEKGILSVTSDKSFVYEFNIGDGYGNLKLWVEKYESGVLVDDVGMMETTLMNNTGKIIYTASDQSDEQNLIDFKFGMIDNDGTSSAKLEKIEIIAGDEIDLMGTWGSFSDRGLPIDGEMILGAIAYAPSTNTTINSIRVDDLNESGADLTKKLKEYDTVFLLRAEFIKD